MVAPASPRQRAANQRNAQQSTGPRTDAGKARSAQNATTHGLTGSSPTLLPGEDPAEFAAFERELLADLRPRGAMQRQLAAQLVWVTWKLNVRLPRTEAAAAAELAARPCQAWDQQVEILRQRVFADPRHVERYAARCPRPPERGGPEAAGVELVDACQGVNHRGEPAKGRKGDEPLSKLEQVACRLRGNLMSLLRLYRKVREEDAEAEQADETEEAPAQNEPKSGETATDETRAVAVSASAPAANPARRETSAAPEMQNEPNRSEGVTGNGPDQGDLHRASGTLRPDLRNREATG